MYSGSDVAKHQKQGGAKLDKKTYYLTERDDLNGHNFVLRTIRLSDVDRDSYHSVQDYVNDGNPKRVLQRDLAQIKQLCIAYMNGKNVPPIVLDEDYRVIDGSHRMAALLYLHAPTVQAYIRQRENSSRFGFGL